MRPALVILVLLALGCSDARKFERIRARHPEWATRDTVHDTINAVVEYVHADTVWKVTRDTLRLDKDRIHVRTVVQHDTLWQEAWSDPDTIRVPVTYTVTKWMPADPWYMAREWWLILAIVVVIGIAYKRHG